MKDDMKGDKKGMGYGGMKDDRQTSDRGWSAPDGLPEAPGKIKKLERPK